MCEFCGIVPALKPESSYWRKMCEYVTNGGKSFSTNGCSLSCRCDFFEKEIAGRKCFAVFDGKIKNYESLRRSMLFKGTVFESEKFSELVLYTYFTFGKSIFKRFEGEFCGVIWDGYENELILFRDKVGFKKLFYYFDGQRLVFSSGIKAILKFPFVKKELADDIYCKLFTFSGSKLNSQTFFNNIYEGKPSSYITYRAGKIKEKSYFIFDFNTSDDSFSQTISALDFLLKDKDFPKIKEKPMSKITLYENVCSFLEKAYMPSPYVNLCDLSNFGSENEFLCNMNLFTIPKRFKLPVKNCEETDREFINSVLSFAPGFSYKSEKDIVKKEELYIKTSIVLPEIITTKRVLNKNIQFPYLTEQVLAYSIQSERHKERLLKCYFKTKSIKPLRENIKVLRALFYNMLKDKNLMLGMIGKEELLKFTRTFPRPETMLYLIQVDMWLNMFL